MTAERWRRVLGWSQAICGGLGIAFVPWTAYRIASITDPNAYVAGVLIYVGLTALAGIGLLRRRDWAVPLSACVQLPQVAWIATPTFLAKFVCGLMLLIQWTPGNVMFRAGFEVSAWLGRNPGPEARLLVINLFPLLALRGLWRMRHDATLADPAKPAEVAEVSQ